LKNKQMQ